MCYFAESFIKIFYTYNKMELVKNTESYTDLKNILSLQKINAKPSDGVKVTKLSQKSQEAILLKNHSNCCYNYLWQNGVQEKQILIFLSHYEKHITKENILQVYMMPIAKFITEFITLISQ